MLQAADRALNLRPPHRGSSSSVQWTPLLRRFSTQMNNRNTSGSNVRPTRPTSSLPRAPPKRFPVWIVAAGGLLLGGSLIAAATLVSKENREKLQELLNSFAGKTPDTQAPVPVEQKTEFNYKKLSDKNRARFAVGQEEGAVKSTADAVVDIPSNNSNNTTADVPPVESTSTIQNAVETAPTNSTVEEVQSLPHVDLVVAEPVVVVAAPDNEPEPASAIVFVDNSSAVPEAVIVVAPVIVEEPAVVVDKVLEEIALETPDVVVIVPPVAAVEIPQEPVVAVVKPPVTTSLPEDLQLLEQRIIASTPKAQLTLENRDPEVIQIVSTLMQDYHEQLRKQREDNNRIVVQAVLNERQLLQESFEASLAQQAQSYEQLLRTKLREHATQTEQDLWAKIIELEKQQKELHEKREGELVSLLERVNNYKNVVHSFSQSKNTSLQVSKLCLALLSFDDALLRHVPFERAVRDILHVSGDNDYVRRAVQSLPQELVHDGVDTLPELASHFKKVSKVARKISFVPEDGSLGWHVFGNFIAKVTTPLSGDVDGNDPEAILARAEVDINKGDLVSALKELKSLPPHVREVTNGWVKRATDRLTVEETARFLRAHALAEASRLNKQ